MASNDNIDCTLVAEIDVTQEIATTEEVIEAEIIVNTDDEIDTIPRIEVELGVTQWSLVSDAIFIKNITGEEPQWFKDMIDDAIRDNDDLITEFEDIYEYINALENGYTNLVSITDDQASHIEALKVSDESNTAAITSLQTVKIDAKQASAISSETVAAWMRGGESAAWFNSHVQAVATNSTANTQAIIKLGAEVDGIESSVTEVSEALVYRYQNPDWGLNCDPAPVGEGDDCQSRPKWIYEARAKHSLEVNANGSISGFIADASSCDPGIPGCEEGARSAFKIFADEFVICDKVDSSGQPGTTAFLIRFPVSGEAPQISLNGDVYFGNIPGYESIEYSLYDIAMDGVVDPVEKIALEKSFQDLMERDAAFQTLVYSTTGRYHQLVQTNPAETTAYNTTYGFVLDLIVLLDIRTDMTIPLPVYEPTELSTILMDRDGFNQLFADYDIAYNKLNELMSNLVKQVADDSYNIMVNILEDNIITVEEKSTIRDYVAQIELKHDQIEADLPIPNYGAYPDCGYAEFSRERLIYMAYVEYDQSMYAVQGDPIPSLCGVPSSGTFPIDGIVVTANKSIYEIYEPDCLLEPIGAGCVDTVVSDIDAQRFLASTRWFVDSRAAFHSAQAGAAIDIQYLRIGEIAVDAPHTLIIDDTIKTGTIGDQDFLDNPSQATGSGVNFVQNKIKITQGSAPISFRIDSEIKLHGVGSVWNGICNDANLSEIRANFLEGSIGSFATLYSGDVIVLADKKHIVKDNIIKTETLNIAVYDLIDEVVILDSVRFYSPTNPDVSQEVMDNRIRKTDSSLFIFTMAGGFLDRKSDVDIMKIGLTLEYNVDDSGWMSVPNQIAGLNNNQTVIMSSPACVNHVDFRMKGNVTSRGMNNAYKKLSYTVALKN